MGSPVESVQPTTMGDNQDQSVLPTSMIGHFQLDTSDKFNEFMTEMGVNWVTRNIANNLYPVQKIWVEEDEVHIDTETSFRSTQTKFKLGEQWPETTADGRYTQTLATLEGRVLKKVQVPDPSTGYNTTQELREMSEDGEVMTMTLIVQGKPEVTCPNIQEDAETRRPPTTIKSSFHILLFYLKYNFLAT